MRTMNRVMTIQVGLRVRPFIGTEGNSGPSGATATANDSYIEKDDSAAGCDRIILHHPKKGKRAFTFNKVFLDSPVPSSSAASSSGSVSTSSVYEGFVRAHVTKVLEGYNACMLLYGETGSGKSYTLWGRAAGRRGIRSGGGGCDDSGILHLAMKDIFERTKNHSATKGDRTRQDVEIECSMMQVYDENMYDLLSSTNGDDGKIVTI